MEETIVIYQRKRLITNTGTRLVWTAVVDGLELMATTKRMLNTLVQEQLNAPVKFLEKQLVIGEHA